MLHSDAEQGGSAGNISADRLKDVVREYLAREDHDQQLAEKLFSGMLERVVFLVSRIEGTYEFEVQPLREYFAAKHLYNLAPYSPPGNENGGTKPDIFRGISANFYWLNVTRFYSGCYSKGELPSLVDCLDELASSELYQFISHPYTLTTMLLSDWVFGQDKRALKRAVEIVLKGLHTRRLATDVGLPTRRSIQSIQLPTGAGREELVEKCFALLTDMPSGVYPYELTDIIQGNTTLAERAQRWKQIASTIAPQRKPEWFSIGCQIGGLAELEHNELSTLAPNEELDEESLIQLLIGGEAAFIESSPLRTELVLSSILDGETIDRRFAYGLGGDATLAWLARAHDPVYYARVRSMGLHLHHPLRAIAPDLKLPESQGPLNICNDFLTTIQPQLDNFDEDWLTEYAPWNAIIEASRAAFGDQWAQVRLGIAAASLLPSQNAKVNDVGLYDVSVPLMHRILSAKRHAGSPVWWERQLEEAASDQQRMLVSLAFLALTGPATAQKTLSTAEQVFELLNNELWGKVATANKSTARLRSVVKDFQPSRFRMALSKLGHSTRAASTLALRLPDDDRLRVYERFLANYTGSEASVVEFCQASTLELALKDPSWWTKALDLILACSSRDFTIDLSALQLITVRSEHSVLPRDIATRVANDPQIYPRAIVDLAESVFRTEIERGIIPVADIARHEQWNV